MYCVSRQSTGAPATLAPDAEHLVQPPAARMCSRRDGWYVVAGPPAATQWRPPAWQPSFNVWRSASRSAHTHAPARQRLASRQASVHAHACQPRPKNEQGAWHFCSSNAGRLASARHALHARASRAAARQVCSARPYQPCQERRSAHTDVPMDKHAGSAAVVVAVSSGYGRHDEDITRDGNDHNTDSACESTGVMTTTSAACDHR